MKKNRPSVSLLLAVAGALFTLPASGADRPERTPPGGPGGQPFPVGGAPMPNTGPTPRAREVRPPGAFTRPFTAPLPGPGEKEVVTFLGVETVPISPTLTAQLGLPNNSGLVVNTLVPDSPGAAALKQHDILLKLDDQLLVDRNQLSVLIRNHQEGDEVTLTYVRAGKQATTRVKLTKREVPKMAAAFESGFGHGGGDAIFYGPAHGAFEVAVPGPDAPGGREHVDRVLSLIHGPGAPGAGPGGAARIQIDGRAGAGFRAMRVNPGNSTLMFSDDAGTLELTMKDGTKTLNAKNPKGESLFSGPVTTPEERKALPAEVRERLEKLEGMQDVTFRTDGDFQGAEMRVMRPSAQGIALPLPPPNLPAVERAPVFF